MKQSILKSTLLALTAAAIIAAPTFATAADKMPDKPEKAAGEVKPAGAAAVNATKKSEADAKEAGAQAEKKREGFRKGKITAIDKVAKTITVGDKVFQVTSDTKIKKAGKPATLDDGAVGDEVGLLAKKSKDGAPALVTLRFGPKPEAEVKGADKKSKGEEKKTEPKKEKPTKSEK